MSDNTTIFLFVGTIVFLLLIIFYQQFIFTKGIEGKLKK